MAKLSNDRYTNFLNKVLEMTKSNNLSWNYLDNNKRLCEGMNWSQNYSGLANFLSNANFDFNTEQSFYCKSGDTYIVLLVYSTNPADIYVVPSTYKNVVFLSAAIYGDIITRLLNIVRAQFPDGEAFIDKFLEK